MPRGNQLTRQWRLLQLIDRPAGVVVDDAARELGCAVRTVWRDLRVLEEAGFPIYDETMADGRRSVWRLEERFQRRLPLKLTLAELAALLMSRDLLASPGAAAPALATAFEKIQGVLSRDALALLDRMRDIIGVRAAGAKLEAPAAEHLGAIHQALVERRRLRLRYYSMSQDEDTERQVDPYHLTFHGGGYYLIGHCHLRAAVRIFAVERIRRLDVLAQRFSPPADFNVDRYLEGAWGIIRGDIVTVKVVFARSVARYIRDRLWHPTQTVRALDGGRIELTLRVADTLEVRRWVLGFGSEAEVIAPVALREAVRREAELVTSKFAPQRVPPAAATHRSTLSFEARPPGRRVRSGGGPTPRSCGTAAPSWSDRRRSPLTWT
jgi:predicted DNA-binding transcriptional regulator YafY